MSDLDEQIAAYTREETELLKLHKGKAAVFAEGKLQGIYDDPSLAAHDALKKFKAGTFLVRIVGDNVMPAKFFLRVA